MKSLFEHYVDQPKDDPIDIFPANWLVGRKEAIRVGNEIYMSPAMLSLYNNPDSIQQQINLLKKIPVVVPGKMPAFPKEELCQAS